MAAADKERGLDISPEMKPLFEFCYLMVNSVESAQETALGVIRSMRGFDPSRKMRGFDNQAKLELFQKAWVAIRAALMAENLALRAGRDTRPIQKMDENLLEDWSSSKKTFFETHREEVTKRLRRLDPDLRAPLILKDVLGLEDEEAMEILELRWAGYRHRLHRARMEMLALLKAKKFTLPVDLKTLPLSPA